MIYSMDKSTNTASQKWSFNSGCFSWPGVMLSAIIIAIRAFQPNATALENWSACSWFLMLLPAILPFAIWIVVAFLALVAIAFSKDRW